jgi:signal transduction histidine kinase
VGVRLSDNGPGFPAALLEAIALARQSEGGFVLGWSSKTGGSGLGLALMDRVAQLHGGHLTIGNTTDGPGAWVQLTRDEHTREEGWLGRLRRASR